MENISSGINNRKILFFNRWFIHTYSNVRIHSAVRKCFTNELLPVTCMNPHAAKRNLNFSMNSYRIEFSDVINFCSSSHLTGNSQRWNPNVYWKHSHFALRWFLKIVLFFILDDFLFLKWLCEISPYFCSISLAIYKRITRWFLENIRLIEKS